MSTRGYSKHTRLSIVTLIVVFLALIVKPTIPFVQAQISSNNPAVFTLDSQPYGVSYAEWTAKFWQWLLEQPSDNNPVNDQTGKNCANNQKDPNVWFIPGTAGGSAERTCTIPAGKAILVSIINVMCSFATDPELKSESELRSCVKDDQDKVTSIELTLDGMNFQDLKKNRIQSPLFNVTLPNNNIFQGEPGPTKAVSDGFWVFLKPLSPGRHELKATGVLVDFTTTGTTRFVTDVTYHLIVK
jgi:hypothetical protein